jgi:hypothetical protein
VFPSGRGSFSGDCFPFIRREFLGSRLSALLPALSPEFDCGAILASIGVWNWHLTSRDIHDEFCELICVARTLAFTNGHEDMMPQPDFMRPSQQISNCNSTQRLVVGYFQLNQLKTPALRFDSVQHTLDFQAKLIQESKDWLALHDRNLVDRYKRVEIEIVAPLRIWDDHRAKANDYHLVISAIPDMRVGHRERSPETTNGTVPTVHDLTERGEEFVFIPITQFVQCPQEVIPSLVRLEAAKERLNLIREISGTANRASHVVDILRERKGTISRVGFADSNSDGVTSIVEDAAKIHNNITGDVPKRIGKWLRELDLVYLPSRLLRVWLDNLFVGIEIVEFSDSPVEIRKEIFLSPCELTA